MAVGVAVAGQAHELAGAGPIAKSEVFGEQLASVQMSLGVGQAGLKTMAISSTSARVMRASDRQWAAATAHERESLWCLRQEKRSSSAKATTCPSMTRQAEGWKQRETGRPVHSPDIFPAEMTGPCSARLRWNSEAFQIPTEVGLGRVEVPQDVRGWACRPSPADVPRP